MEQKYYCPQCNGEVTGVVGKAEKVTVTVKNYGIDMKERTFAFIEDDDYESKRLSIRANEGEDAEILEYEPCGHWAAEEDFFEHNKPV